MGRERTFCVAWPMSVLPSEADITERDRHVRKVPKAEVVHWNNEASYDRNCRIFASS
jgi:hypothetical protein